MADRVCAFEHVLLRFLMYRREFHLTSEMHGKVLDVRGGNKAPGAHVIVYGKHSPPSKNQMWYLDQQGFIRSALNDFALDASKVSHSALCN